MLSHFTSIPNAFDVSASLVPAKTGDRKTPQVLHRLREVREREEVSLRTMARRLHVSISEVERQERDPDPRWKTIAAWAEALEVPVAELVGDVASVVAERIAWRAQLINVMRSVRTIQQLAKNKTVRRVTEDLVERLLGMMPELHDVGALPAVGQSYLVRTSRIEEQLVSTSLLPDFTDESDSGS